MQDRIKALKNDIENAKDRMASLQAMVNNPDWKPAEQFVLYHDNATGHRMYYQRRGDPPRNGFYADVRDDLGWVHTMSGADADGNIKAGTNIDMAKESCAEFLARRILDLERLIAHNTELINAVESTE